MSKAFRIAVTYPPIIPLGIAFPPMAETITNIALANKNLWDSPPLTLTKPIISPIIINIARTIPCILVLMFALNKPRIIVNTTPIKKIQAPRDFPFSPLAIRHLLCWKYKEISHYKCFYFNLLIINTIKFEI